MYSEVFSVAVRGIDGCMIRVEADVSDGLPMFSMVGFLSSEVKEARERVCVAIKNSGIKTHPKKITVNLSPADIRKAGTGYDLAIAVAVLTAFGFIPNEYTKDVAFIGELSLDGNVKPVDGILPMVYTAYENGFSTCVVAMDNLMEAQVVEGISVLGVTSLRETVKKLCDGCIGDYIQERQLGGFGDKDCDTVDFAEVRGQKSVKRAVEVAVAGMHNILMVGPPGTGKTMIAKRIPGIMPKLGFDESMEISKIYSVSGLLSKDMPFVNKRPFRSPHHTVTKTALVGGGRFPKPGEVSLASSGVLFLDELPEFGQQLIEVLRQPLEDGVVNVSRLEGSYRYPARCQLVAAMNPCRCGYYPDRSKCSCSSSQIRGYLSRISRPMLDRIDICTETVPISYPELNFECGAEFGGEETSAEIRERVYRVHKIQKDRYCSENFLFNALLPAGKIQQYCQMAEDAEEYLHGIFNKMSFSARMYHKLLRVGRTIADLDGKELIEKKHISEAVCYRLIDRKYWGNEWM